MASIQLLDYPTKVCPDIYLYGISQNWVPQTLVPYHKFPRKTCNFGSMHHFETDPHPVLFTQMYDQN